MSLYKSSLPLSFFLIKSTLLYLRFKALIYSSSYLPNSISSFSISYMNFAIRLKTKSIIPFTKLEAHTDVSFLHYHYLPIMALIRCALLYLCLSAVPVLSSSSPPSEPISQRHNAPCPSVLSTGSLRGIWNIVSKAGTED